MNCTAQQIPSLRKVFFSIFLSLEIIKRNFAINEDANNRIKSYRSCVCVCVQDARATWIKLKKQVIGWHCFSMVSVYAVHPSDTMQYMYLWTNASVRFPYSTNFLRLRCLLTYFVWLLLWSLQCLVTERCTFMQFASAKCDFWFCIRRCLLPITSKR